MQDEPEPLLKRQRLKNQSSQPNESVESHLQNQSLGVFDSPQAIGNESLGRNKGKQPILSNSLAAQEGFPSSQPSGVDKSLSVPRRAGSTSGSAIPVSPTKNVIANHTFIKPKDEPVTDDLPHLEVPLAVTRPGRDYLISILMIQFCDSRRSVGRRDSFVLCVLFWLAKF